MKTRNGFVSNSSSSSFVVAYKVKPTPEALANELLATDMFKELALQAAELLLDARPYELEEAEQTGDHLLGDDRVIKAFADGWTVLYGDATDENDAPDLVVCRAELDIETPNLLVYKEADY